jgi:hypothetical protein
MGQRYLSQPADDNNKDSDPTVKPGKTATNNGDDTLRLDRQFIWPEDVLKMITSQLSFTEVWHTKNPLINLSEDILLSSMYVSYSVISNGAETTLPRATR